MESHIPKKIDSAVKNNARNIPLISHQTFRTPQKNKTTKVLVNERTPEEDCQKNYDDI